MKSDFSTGWVWIYQKKKKFAYKIISFQISKYKKVVVWSLFLFWGFLMKGWNCNIKFMQNSSSSLIRNGKIENKFKLNRYYVTTFAREKRLIMTLLYNERNCAVIIIVMNWKRSFLLKKIFCSTLNEIDIIIVISC